MKRTIKLFLIFLFVFVMVACNNETKVSNEQVDNIETETEKNTEKRVSKGNPTVEEVLGKNQDADIFYLGKMVFKNAQDIKWVTELEIVLGEEVAEIKKQTTIISEFEDATASKLPVGTKIYKIKNYPGPIYIVVKDGENIPYLGLMEG